MEARQGRDTQGAPTTPTVSGLGAFPSLAIMNPLLYTEDRQMEEEP
jgi:hypothetical protein